MTTLVSHSHQNSNCCQDLNGGMSEEYEEFRDQFESITLCMEVRSSIS